jgi:hypothetical protein
MGYEQAARHATWNPDIDPTLTYANTAYRLTNAAYEELVLLKPHQTPRHDGRCYATPKVEPMKLAAILTQTRTRRRL